jgi:hypothetical protein
MRCNFRLVVFVIITFSFIGSYATFIRADEPNSQPQPTVERPKHFRVDLVITPKLIEVVGLSIESDYARAYGEPNDDFHVTVLDKNKKSLREISIFDPLQRRIYEPLNPEARLQNPNLLTTDRETRMLRREAAATPAAAEQIPEENQRTFKESHERVGKAQLSIFIPFQVDAQSLRMTYRMQKLVKTVSLVEVIRKFCHSTDDSDCQD